MDIPYAQLMIAIAEQLVDLCYDEGINSLAGPVDSTDWDWLTTHSGKTLPAFNQTRVPGLESGTNWSDSTKSRRTYWIELQYNYKFYPIRPSGFFIMSIDTEILRIHVAGMFLSLARKFGGYYLCTKHATSEIFAMGATREFCEYDFVIFWTVLDESCPLSSDILPLFYRVRDSAPDGSSPRDCVVLFAMEENLKFAYSICS